MGCQVIVHRPTATRPLCGLQCDAQLVEYALRRGVGGWCSRLLYTTLQHDHHAVVAGSRGRAYDLSRRNLSLQYSRQQRAYQLTQAQAAKLFGGGPVAFSKYENDDVAQSEAMDTLLRLVRRSPEAFWALVEEKAMQAEFTQRRAPVKVENKVVRLVARAEFATHDPRYNPREFRSVSHEELTCQT